MDFAPQLKATLFIMVSTGLISPPQLSERSAQSTSAWRFQLSATVAQRVRCAGVFEFPSTPSLAPSPQEPINKVPLVKNEIVSTPSPALSLQEIIHKLPMTQRESARTPSYFQEVMHKLPPTPKEAANVDVVPRQQAGPGELEIGAVDPVFRKLVDKILAQKCADLERKILSSVQPCIEKTKRQLDALEEKVCETLADKFPVKDAAWSIAASHVQTLDLVSRIERLESQAAKGEFLVDSHLGTAPSRSGEEADRILVEEVSQRLADVSKQLRDAIEDGREVRTRLAVDEEQIKMLRASVDAREAHVRSLSERIGSVDWPSKFEGLRQSLLEVSKLQLDQDERIQSLSRKAREQEQSHEEMQNVLCSGSRTPTMQCARNWAKLSGT